MPFVRIQLKSGRTEAQKKELAEAILDKMTELDFASREAIRIIYEDMADEDYYSGQHHKKKSPIQLPLNLARLNVGVFLG